MARPRPYERRRTTPAIVVGTVLAVVAAVTWTVVLATASGGVSGTSCNLPGSGGGLPGEVLSADAVEAVRPVPASGVRVRVFNAGGQRGQANLVAAQLGDLGFAESAPPDNDPLYSAADLDCRGQLRFGPAGEPAAATLALVLPCTELVRDGRADAGVDVAIGTEFSDVNPSRTVRDILDQLAEPAPTDPGAADPTSDQPATPSAADPELVEQARAAGCG